MEKEMESEPAESASPSMPAAAARGSDADRMEVDDQRDGTKAEAETAANPNPTQSTEETTAATLATTSGGTEADPQSMESSSTSTDSPLTSPSLSLHDCLSLGEIELGLSNRCGNPSHGNDGDPDRADADSYKRREQRAWSAEEVRRLPYLLRILSKTRPLASVQTFPASKSKQGTEENDEDGSDFVVDEDIDRVVDRLEDAAAIHSVSGGIDVVTNYLAPSVTKQISRLSPLTPSVAKEINQSCPPDNDANNSGGRRDSKSNSKWIDYWWYTVKKRKRRETDVSQTKKRKLDGSPMVGNENTDAEAGANKLGASSDEDDETNVAMDASADETLSMRARPPLKRRDSILVAAEDSQESTVTKTLSELTRLVVASLDDSSNQYFETEGDDDPQQWRGASGGGKRAPYMLSLNTDDILSEKAASASTEDGIATDGSDLASTVVAIMHNAPPFKSRHVASALCRASVPRAGNVISDLGANCPASVSSLLQGCIEAYSMAMKHHCTVGFADLFGSAHKNNEVSCTVVAAAKSSATALARLSPTESVRVRNKLQSCGIMLDVQLKLAMETAAARGSASGCSIVPVACLLLEHLSFPAATTAADSETATEITRKSANEPSEASEGGRSPGETGAEDCGNDDEVITSYARKCSKGSEPSLLLYFVENPALYRRTLDFFSRTMAVGASTSLTATGGRVITSKGKWCLLLRSFFMLLLVPLPSIDTSDLGVAYENAIKSFVILVKSFDCTKEDKDNTGQKRVKEGDIDSLSCLASSSGVLLLSKYLASKPEQGSAEGGYETRLPIDPLVETVLKSIEKSLERSHLTRPRFRSHMQRDDVWGSFKLILYPLELTTRIEKTYATNAYRCTEVGIRLFWKLAEPLLDVSTIEEKRSVAFDVSSLLNVLRMEPNSTDDSLVEETEKLLDYLLKGVKEEEAESLMGNIECAQFIAKATKFLSKPETLEVPKVLPIHLDMAWSKIVPGRASPSSKTIDGVMCSYLFKFLYAFEFLDTSPLSPFVFDPRSMPMKETLSMIQTLSSKPTRDYLLSEINALILKHCPEFALHRFEQRLDLGPSPAFDAMDRNSLLEALSNCIREGLHQGRTEVCKGTIEQLFLQAKSRVCDSEVLCAVTNSFLSSPHAPLPTYSYKTLCRDPIVCLKFPLSVWQCRSLRRIALSVLENLLLSNNSITSETSKSSGTALELLVARDAIIVRCLLAVLHSGDSKNLAPCSMTTSFIRWLIQSRSGLVALLVKQGLREQDLDWLVENVPETMNDSQYLLQIFSERNRLTAAERLVAADTIVRIAVVHGQANEADSSQLILTAVSQLVDSFHVILGPVGLLPVDALFNAESTTSITQISQKAAFRILKALTKIRGARCQIRRDCNMVLQKLVGLCKAELQGTVAGRRKQFLKELYDAAVKAEK